MRLGVTYGLLLLVFVTALGAQHMTKAAWEKAILASLHARMEAINTRNVTGLEVRLSKDVHEFRPGGPKLVGVPAVMDFYYKMDATGSWPTTLSKELTGLRFYSDKEALAEFHATARSAAGKIIGVNGLVLFVIEDGALKVHTKMYNRDS